MSLCLKSFLFLALAFCCLPVETGVSQCCKKRNFDTPMIPVWDQIGMMHPFHKSYGPPVWEQIGSMNPYHRISLPPISPCVGCQPPAIEVAPVPLSQPAPAQMPMSDEPAIPTPREESDVGQSSTVDGDTQTLTEMAEQKRRARAKADADK